MVIMSKPTIVTLPNRQMMLDAAMEYISNGYSVLPLHTIIDGACTCGNDNCASPGKHPLTKNGHLDASSDEVMVRGWWAKWPFANIGMAITNGMVVVDVDPRNGGDFQFEMLEAEHGKFPDTATQLTGGGGFHYIYRTARDTSTLPGRLGKGIDLKTSGFIVVWPSVHISGNTYEHEASSNMLDGFHLNEPPQWIFNIARTEVSHSGTRLCSAEQITELRSALNFLDADDYHNWINIGLSLSTIGQQGYGLWDEWSQLSDKYDAAVLRDKWRSFRNSNSSRNIESIFFEAQQAGWKNPLKANNEPRIIAESKLTIVTVKPIDAAPLAIELPALVDTLKSWAERTAHKKQPELNLNAVLAGLSALLGRRVKTDRKSWPALYFQNQALAGEGKEHGRSIVNAMLESCDQSHRLGGGGFTSAGAVCSALLAKPAVMVVVDELGRKIASSKGDKSGNQQSAATEIMSLFGLANSIYTPPQYSTMGMTKDQREAWAKLKVLNPSLTLLNMSTPDTFYSSITTDYVADGFISRFLIVDSQMPRQLGTFPSDEPVPDMLKAWFELFKSQMDEMGNMVKVTTSEGHTEQADMAPVPVTLTLTRGSIQMLLELEQSVMQVKNMLDKDGLSECLARTVEKASRLAIIFAVASDPTTKVVDEDATYSAIEYVRHHDMRLVDKIRANVSDSEFGARRNKLINAIVKSGADGITERDMKRKVKAFKDLRPKEQRELLESLVSAEMAVPVARKSTNGGRTSVTWIASQFIEGDDNE